MIETIEKQLREEGFYVSTTVGMSMHPMLKNRRDRVIIKPIDSHPLCRLDVPLYRRPDGKYVLHRILKVKDGYYIIRGDNTFQKEIVPFEWVVGVMTEFYRKDRHVLAQDKGYRRYAALWHAIYPLRLPLHGLRSIASKIKHKLIRSK